MIISQCEGQCSNNPWCSYGWSVSLKLVTLPLLYFCVEETDRLCINGHQIYFSHLFFSTTPSWYICTKLLFSLYTCHISQRCKLCADVQPSASAGFPLCSVLSTCTRACVGWWGTAVSGNDFSNMEMNYYNHWVITPKSSTPTTVYNINPPHTPPLFCFFTLLSSHLPCLCWGSLFLSQWKPLTVFHCGGNPLLYFCFYFVKLMIHIVLEPPATIKTVKGYSIFFSVPWYDVLCL